MVIVLVGTPMIPDHSSGYDRQPLFPLSHVTYSFQSTITEPLTYRHVPD